MMWSISSYKRKNSLQRKFADRIPVPAIPEFPAGNATFVITSGDPTAETLASIQSLHDLYNNEHDRLKAAYEGRERAQRLHEAKLKANPPQLKNIVLNYWRSDSAAKTAGKGAAR